jgi:hypothetical protein
LATGVVDVVVGGFEAGVVVLATGVVVLAPEVDFAELPPPDEVAAVPVRVPAVVELGFTCWVNGFRSRPVSRASLGVVVTLTAGSAGAGADPIAAGTGAAATGVLELERRRGTAISARIRAAAMGHRRFSRSSEINCRAKFMA